MNRRIAGLILGVVTAAAAGCKSDPTADLANGPAAIVTNFSQLVIDVGDSTTFTASVVNAQGFPIEEPVAFAACDAKVTVRPDTTLKPPAPNQFRAIVKAVTAGSSCVNASGAGLTTQVGVTIP
jgi:hypothetical protein